jgi:hypothetical protein
MHFSVIYAYHILRRSYMFRRYYLAVFRELTPIFFKRTAIKEVTVSVQVVVSIVRCLLVLAIMIYINIT